MDTISFLNKILPDSGVKFLAKRKRKPDHPSGGYPIHIPFGEDDNVGMAERAVQLDRSGEDVYFACASFNEVIYNTTAGGYEYPAGRTQENAKYVKSFWLDMDVGKEDKSKSYDTQREAATDVVRLVKEVGLPEPMLVSSGAGLHVYWPLTEQVDVDRWSSIAQQLKSVCAHLNVKADPSRTADAASVLRPVGTRNPKHGKEVRLLRDADPVHVGKIAAALADYILSNHVIHTRRDRQPSANSALIGGQVYPPSHPEQLIKGCAVMAHFYDKSGNVSEPFWYAALGLLKHCENGEELAHKWSEGHPDYDRDATQRKLDQWSAGPSLCSKFESDSGLGVCKTCLHYGKIKSPIQLGYTAPSEEERTVQVEPSKPGAEVEAIHMPPNYTWDGNALRHFKVSADGQGEHVPFSDTLFYPVNRVRDEDGTWNLRIRMSVAGHYWREFDLPQMLIPDNKGLARHLAKYEIIIFGIKHAMDYLKDYTAWMREQDMQVVTYNRFGWDEDKFIVGSTAFLRNGTTEPVLVTDNVVNSGRAFDAEPQGDLDTWVDLVDKAYNRPEAEKYQFVIAAGFASALVPLANFHNYRGIPIVLSGEGSCGKSSICKVASTIYARPNGLLVDAAASNGATLQGLVGLASMFNGVPLLFDEVTERDPKDFTPLMYSLSNGQSKVRMTSGGRFAETAAPFCGIYFGTSNTNVTDMIYSEEKKDVSDAASARCFEIGNLSEAETARVFKGVNMKDLLEHQLFNHHGVAAQVYIPFVSKHRETIVRMLVSARNSLGSDAQSNSRERFYIDTIAFAHVAAKVAKKLGLIKWDVDAMTKWATDHLASLRRDFASRTALVEDNISIFLSWLHSRTIVTRTFQKGRIRSDEIETVNDTLRGTPCARVATKDHVMLVSIAAINEWCKEYNVVPEKFKDQLKRGNYILGERREYLGRGTNIVTGQSRVMELNYAKVVGVTSFSTEGNVTVIQREEGQMEAAQ